MWTSSGNGLAVASSPASSAPSSKPSASPATARATLLQVAPLQVAVPESAALDAAEQLQRLETIFRLAPVGIGIVDLDGQTIMSNDTLRQMLGYSAEEFATMPWTDYTHADDVAKNVDLYARMAVHEIDHFELEKRFIRKDGSLLWAGLTSSMVYRPDGTPDYVIGMVADITERKRLEERLGHQAFHDPLTRLPNRRLFHDRVDEALARLDEGGSVAVLFVDLDDFKTINDSFGHGYGDQVIVAASCRIRSCARTDDTAARLGGDEFALLVEGLSVEHVSELADRVLFALRGTPMRLGELTVTVGGSVGIAHAVPGDTTETLLRNADLAMYQAKRQGRGRHISYDGGMYDEVVSRFRIEEALQAAVAEDRITLAYQPIVDLRTGEVAGLEALARWTDPELGAVSPAEFIPVAEQTGLIRVLGRDLLRKACQGLAGWRAATGAEAYVSVNVSPLQLDDDFPAVVEGILRDCGLAPSALVLEVTEGLMLVERSHAPISALRSRGVRVALDDFGTGYSSLSYLRELPVDLIKIDQVFLRPGPQGEEDSTLLHAIIRLAESLRLGVICEGVETEVQLADLQSTGCGYAQGYLLRRPGPWAAIPALFEAARVGQHQADRALF